MGDSIYFTDNFFSAGITEIYDSGQEKVGSLDLKSAFSSSVDILDLEGNIMMKGHFPFLSRGWVVKNASDQEIGKLKQRFSFFTKKFVYQSYLHGDFEIQSEPFSKEYTILDSQQSVIAEFKKISGFFQSSAFELTNHSSVLTNEELIAIVMGVSMVIKRNSSAAANGGAGS
ncbi:hypothetical protein [Aquibacillus salsiterrae]|uniref:Uncharacterized protein n=1 Tax=Aquibacillus salsiterrae TaxID=2950439 RepID=A0A9X3WGL1_9BACI|nr:hypothetical protein [Aquibacillus salsiterrae]MDC3416656.1 hypothetical protein [Aquibacillus salsiterrae]